MTVSVITYSFLVISEFEAWELTPINANNVLSDEMAGTDLRGLSTWTLSSNDFTLLPILPFYICWSLNHVTYVVPVNSFNNRIA